MPEHLWRRKAYIMMKRRISREYVCGILCTALLQGNHGYFRGTRRVLTAQGWMSQGLHLSQARIYLKLSPCTTKRRSRLCSIIWGKRHNIWMWFLALAVLTFFFREDDLIFLPFFLAFWQTCFSWRYQTRQTIWLHRWRAIYLGSTQFSLVENVNVLCEDYRRCNCISACVML